MTTPETQLSTFFARYDPATAKLGKALRARLRDRLPGLHEIVYLYEGQNALLISYSPTGKGYGGLCSLALYPDGVKLHFSQAPLLSKHDPAKLLQGRGKTVRHVVIDSLADFNRAEVEALLSAAVKLAKVRLEPGAERSVIVKADEQKQRARRAKAAARPASTAPKAKSRR